MFLPKLKSTGLMCGHDYNPRGTEITDVGFGVSKAVHEFMDENNFKMITTGEDFALIKN